MDMTLLQLRNDETRLTNAESKRTYVTIASDESATRKFKKAVADVRRELGDPHPMHIGGAEVLSGSGEFEVRSPVDERVIVGRFQKAASKDFRDAVDAAAKAFCEWRDTSYSSRTRIFRKAARIIEDRVFELSAYTYHEVGKGKAEALAEIFEVVDWLDYYCDQLERERGFVKVMKSPVANERCMSVLKPYGPWCCISPFNFPFALSNNMCAGALMMGNTVVYKPTSAAPLTGLKLYEVYREAGVPPGVVNFVTGSGRVFGDEIAGNPKVAGLAFVGSMDVGKGLVKRFMNEQPYPKPSIIETGSKNPCIVTAKADLDKAVSGVVNAAFGFQGQKCSATSRVYVERSVASKFTDALVRRTKELVVGDPVKDGVFVGPVIDDVAKRTFEQWVSAAKESGGKVLAGGRVITAGDCANGHYVQPTVIGGLPCDHALFKQELFLPVLALAEVDGLDEALAQANDTDYGLTSGIYSEDPSEIERFFNRIEFGVCYANRPGGATTGAWPGAQSFVGWKASGNSGKGALGPHYLQGFAREQSYTLVH